MVGSPEIIDSRTISRWWRWKAIDLRRTLMSTFTIAAEVASALGQLKERTEIRDSQGKILGVFTPQAHKERLESLFTLEEAERIASTDSENYSLEQVKAYLGSLEKKE